MVKRFNPVAALRRAIALPLAGLTFGFAPAMAEVPVVVTSFAPVQGMVAAVMGDLGTPAVLLEGAQSPHDFALRPSQVRAIAGADLVVRLGLDAEPWLERIWDEGPRYFSLGDTGGLQLLPARDSAVWETEDDEDDHGHDEDATDPHIWLDPANLQALLQRVAEILAEADPGHADRYRDNAAKAVQEVQSETQALRARLDALPQFTFLVSHDSLQYLENAFGLNALGAFRMADGQSPGARSFSAVSHRLAETNCLLADAAHPLPQAAASAPGLKVVKIDVLGAEFAQSPEYPAALLRSLGDALTECAE